MEFRHTEEQARQMWTLLDTLEQSREQLIQNMAHFGAHLPLGESRWAFGRFQHDLDDMLLNITQLLAFLYTDIRVVQEQMQTLGGHTARDNVDG